MFLKSFKSIYFFVFLVDIDGINQISNKMTCLFYIDCFKIVFIYLFNIEFILYSSYTMTKLLMDEIICFTNCTFVFYASNSVSHQIECLFVQHYVDYHNLNRGKKNQSG